MTSGRITLTVLLAALSLPGCSDPREEFGKTYYLDGAGNWGFGVADVANGLERAGYDGAVETFLWTTSFNPAIDQVNRIGARLRALGLAGLIDDYIDKHPDKDVNVIALSAGTGVTIWAIENLRAGHQVNNVVLLGSSLSYDYDIRKAAENIRGKIYVYFSPHDTILQAPVRALGTIDGKLNHEAAGLVGLHPPHGPDEKVVNTAWNRRYVRYGWTGAHTDCTSEPFVRNVLARHILPSSEPTPEQESAPATQPADLAARGSPKRR